MNQVDPATGEHEDARLAPPAIGQRVNNYQIVSKLGEGGMGVVYLCRHQFFERSAALKVLHPHLGRDEHHVRRFMNEARAVNAISHPNIVDVFDTGFLEGSGAPYLLMEYLAGESLGTRLHRLGRLLIPEALEIAGQTASALAAAHGQGIIHRDLKPENLFLVPRASGRDLVKVLDFGIAKLHPDLAEAGPTTQPGELVGTPRYMSPEQCRGTWPVDQRTDVYALGILLYEMLCGTPPFVSDAIGEMLAIQLTREPAPLRTHLPEVPAALEHAVLRALRKNPDERFASMHEFQAALGPGAIVRLTTQEQVAEPDGPPPFWPTPAAAALVSQVSPRRRPKRRLALFALTVLAGAGVAGVWADRTGRLPARWPWRPAVVQTEAVVPPAGEGASSVAAPVVAAPAVERAPEVVEHAPEKPPAVTAPPAPRRAKGVKAKSPRAQKAASIARRRAKPPRTPAPVTAPSWAPPEAPKAFVPPLW